MEKRYMLLIVIFSFFGFFLFVGNKQSYAYDSESEDDFDINLIYSEYKNIFKNDLLVPLVAVMYYLLAFRLIYLLVSSHDS